MANLPYIMVIIFLLLTLATSIYYSYNKKSPTIIARSIVNVAMKEIDCSIILCMWFLTFNIFSSCINMRQSMAVNLSKITSQLIRIAIPGSTVKCQGTLSKLGSMKNDGTESLHLSNLATIKTLNGPGLKLYKWNME